MYGTRAFGQACPEGTPPAAWASRRGAYLTSAIAALALSGCAQKPTPEYSSPVARPVTEVVAEKPVKAAQPLAQPSKPVGVPVVPKSLGFVQKGLHNCGTVAMLLSWTNLHPREAATLVRRQTDGTYNVRFVYGNTVRVTADDLKAARQVQVVQCNSNDRWAEIVLTAFAKLAGQGRAFSGLRSTPKLDFAAIEWISSSAIGTYLSGNAFNFFEIKPETLDAKKRVQVGAPVSATVLEQQLRAMKGRPATAYTNRRIHIWTVLDYDTQRKRVYARNPRRTQGEWLSLSEFRQRFQLLVYSNPATGSNA